MDDKMQSVVLTFSDKTTALFTGKAIFFPGDPVKEIVEIKFSVPTNLPDDYSWEVLPDDVKAA